MTAREFITKMKKIQFLILNYIDNQSHYEINYNNLIRLFDRIYITENIHEVKSVLHLILQITKVHHRQKHLYPKICKIINYFKDTILNNFPNWEIFNIFKGNKRILLFLIQENILIIDDYVINKITKDKFIKSNYHLYFWPEMKALIPDEKFSRKYNYCYFYLQISEDISDKFFEKARSHGRNDDHICRLIRDDDVKELESFIETEHFDYSYLITQSFYETNSFLLQKDQLNLIEYAAFSGSEKIFNFLKEKGIELTPYLWLLAIHSNNLNIIHILEENHIVPSNKVLNECFIESIKCQHRETTEYLICNYLLNDEENSPSAIEKYFKYYDFDYIQNEFFNVNLFYILCQYDYYILVDILIKENHIDINQKITKRILN